MIKSLPACARPILTPHYQANFDTEKPGMRTIEIYSNLVLELTMRNRFLGRSSSSYDSLSFFLVAESPLRSVLCTSNSQLMRQSVRTKGVPLPMLHNSLFPAGNRVRVTSHGPFRGLNGTIRQIDSIVDDLEDPF